MLNIVVVADLYLTIMLLRYRVGPTKYLLIIITMEENYFKQREDFRVVMLQALKIPFPKMVWRQAVKFLGHEQARVMFKLMKGNHFYLLFMVDPQLPDDVKTECEDLFENPNLAKVMNAFRVAKVQSYLTISGLSAEMQSFLEALFYYLKASCNGYGCCDDFVRAQKHFKQIEHKLFENAEKLSDAEKDLLITVVVMAVEEFSKDSFDKTVEFCSWSNEQKILR